MMAVATPGILFLLARAWQFSEKLYNTTTRIEGKKDFTIPAKPNPCSSRRKQDIQRLNLHHHWSNNRTFQKVSGSE
jgi:hypothetical protein